jgi:hypothetical protein
MSNHVPMFLPLLLPSTKIPASGIEVSASKIDGRFGALIRVRPNFGAMDQTRRFLTFIRGFRCFSHRR